MAEKGTIGTAPRWLGRAKDTRYWRGQVLPRWRELVLDWYLILGFDAGLVAVLLSVNPSKENLKLSELVTAELAFAAISFGACITGSVLVITLAPTDQVKVWSSKGRTKDSYFSHYSNLIFTFTWAAIAQLAVICASIVLLTLGPDAQVLLPDPSVVHLAILALDFGIVTYAFLQLFTVISTISQIGVVFINQAISPTEKGSVAKDE
ncbi:MAG: hypothetical protein Q8L08_04440 [Candidatus Nanopelagicaceae bacterium]|nr:hypothetical protein [Candidatus Nanopelagicaceae bacterium]